MGDADRIAAEIDLAWLEREQIKYQSTRAVRRGLLAGLAERQNWRCCHCGRQMDGGQPGENAPRFEYVVLRSRGGTEDRDNLVAICSGCSVKRGLTVRAKQG